MALALTGEGLAVGLALIGVVLVAPTDAAGRPELTWGTSAIGISTHLAYAAICVVAFRLSNGSVRASDLGLRRVPWRPAVIVASVGYAGYVVAAATLGAIVGDPEEREVLQAIDRVDSLALLGAIAMSACVLAPISEELLNRGLLFPALRARLGVIPGIVIAGSLFGLLHGPPLDGAIQIAFLGIALCAIYQYAGSLLPCIAVHAAHNGLAFAATVDLARPLGLAIALAGVVAALLVTAPLSARQPPVAVVD